MQHAYDVLSRLVSEAERTLTAPVIGQHRRDELITLSDDVNTFAGKPVDGPRFVGFEATQLARTIEELQRLRNCGAHTQRVAALAGVLLAFVRHDLFECGIARLRERPATTEQGR